MLRWRFTVYRKINIAIDVVICAGAFIAAQFLMALPKNIFYHFDEFVRMKSTGLVTMSVLWPLLLNLNGLYPTSRLRGFFNTGVKIIRTSVQGLLIVFTALMMFGYHVRPVFFESVLFAVLATALLFIKELAVIWRLRFLRKAGKNVRNVLLAGTPATVSDIDRLLNEHKFLGLHVIGFLSPHGHTGNGTKVEGVPLLGSFNDLDMVLHAHPVDNLIVTCSDKHHEEIQRMIYTAENEGVEIWISSEIFNVNISRLDSDELFGRPFLIFRTEPVFSFALLTKAVLDLVGGLFFSLIGAPIVAFSAALIKFDSPGPVFFNQVRCGLRGRKFTVHKLRTMEVGAEQISAELEKNNLMKGPIFKMRNDPRITRVGRFLRKTSIDELPQLWNVLKGEMSIVGPRPPLPEEVEKYEAWQRRRLSMKPGITGLWQVSGRDDITDFKDRANLDLKYIDNWSLSLDLKILWRTIFVLFRGT